MTLIKANKISQVRGIHCTNTHKYFIFFLKKGREKKMKIKKKKIQTKNLIFIQGRKSQIQKIVPRMQRCMRKNHK